MIFSFGSFYRCSFVLINWLFLILRLFFSSRSGRAGPLLSVLSESRQRYFKRQPVESVPGASEKPAVNCRPRFVTAEGAKGALRLPPPPKSRHEVMRHSTRRAVSMDDGGCNRGHFCPIKGTSGKRLPGAEKPFFPFRTGKHRPGRSDYKKARRKRTRGE